MLIIQFLINHDAQNEAQTPFSNKESDLAMNDVSDKCLFHFSGPKTLRMPTMLIIQFLINHDAKGEVQPPSPNKEPDFAMNDVFDKILKL